MEESATVTITNVANLSNLAINVANTDFAAATIDQGEIKITAIAVGTTSITVSADNATDATIAVTVETKSITISDTASKVAVNGTSTLTVTNASYLTDLAVVSNDTSSITVVVDQSTGLITLTGVKTGTTTLTVSAVNVADVTVDVTITDEIFLSQSGPISLIVTDTATINVENYASLGDISVSGGNSYASVSYRSGVITLTGLETGQATITVNGQYETSSKSIVVNFSRTDIVLSSSSVTVQAGSNDSTISFTNSSTLKELSVSSSNTAVATASVSNGVITVNGIANGTATITVNASNGNSKTISLSVADSINLSAGSLDIQNSSSSQTNTSVSVTNASRLTNLSVSVSDSTILSSVTVNQSTGVISMVTVTGIDKIGTSTITVKDDGLDDVTITVVLKAAIIFETIPTSVSSTTGDFYAITNYVLLDGSTGGISVVSSDTNILTATINPIQANLILTKVSGASGSVTITISGTYVVTQTFPITVN